MNLTLEEEFRLFHELAVQRNAERQAKSQEEMRTLIKDVATILASFVAGGIWTIWIFGDLG